MEHGIFFWIYLKCFNLWASQFITKLLSMKRLIPTFFICTLFVFNSYSQIVWQEHLSHDRMTSKHYGHFMIDGDLTLLLGNTFPPMNTLETIVANAPKAQEIIREYSSYETKTTRTGIDSKEILLKEAQDYDILGNGAYSIYERDDDFLIRHIQGDYYVEPEDALYIKDAYMSGGPLDNKECITLDNIRYYLNSEDVVLGSMEIDGNFVYHEGLDGLPYQILNGTLSSITIPPKGPLELGTYDMVENDPYENHLVKIEGTTATRFSYDDFSLAGMHELEANPFGIQFIEGGFYYFIKSTQEYTIYKYSNENSTSELLYEFPITSESKDFDIKSIEVDGDDIYFMGLWWSSFLKRNLSYVQKRTLNKPFNPQRKDLAITDITIIREKSDYYGFNYDYEIEITNTGDLPMNYFTVMSEKLSEDFSNMQYYKQNIEQSISPGQSFTLKGKFFNYPYKTQMAFNIVGVDFGFDSDDSNNTFTADITVLSNKDIEHQKFVISPNPSSDYISISGPVAEVKEITITDLNNRTLQLPVSDLSKIDISHLSAGQYWINITTKSKIHRETIVKL